MNRSVYTKTLYLHSEKLHNLNRIMREYRETAHLNNIILYEKSVNIHDAILFLYIRVSHGYSNALLVVYDSDGGIIGRRLKYISTVTNLTIEFKADIVYRLVILEMDGKH